MMHFNDIDDDQIRLIGEPNKEPRPKRRWWIIAAVAVVIATVISVIFLCSQNDSEEMYCENPLFYCEASDGTAYIYDGVAETRGYTLITDTTINDIPLRAYTPYGATMSLHIGALNKNDSTIVYAARAADIRADNGGIVGAFVLNGEPRAWGISKKGYCAAINGKVVIGVAKNTHLFELATEQGGYFFRQYPLVSNGKLIENEPKGKSIRRAICEQQGKIFMVETITRESFHDFAQALVDIGADNAIYLTGSSAYGWAVDQNGIKHEFGEDDYYTGKLKMPKNINYIVWRTRVTP